MPIEPLEQQPFDLVGKSLHAPVVVRHAVVGVVPAEFLAGPLPQFPVSHLRSLLARLSNSGAYHQSKYAEVVEVSILISKMPAVAFVSWLLTLFYPLRRQLSSFWSLPYKVVSYLYYSIHQELVQWSD